MMSYAMFKSVPMAKLTFNCVVSEEEWTADGKGGRSASATEQTGNGEFQNMFV